MVERKTITSLFILPILNIDRYKLFKNNFINSYLGDINNDLYHQEDVIFLLFKPEAIDEFKIFLEEEYDKELPPLDDYDYEQGYVVVVYKLDMSFEKDFNLIKQGKYSKTSKKFKNMFPKNVTYISEPNGPKRESLQHMIFNKSEKLIDYFEELINTNLVTKENLEVWHTFDEKTEILDINKLLE